MLLIHKCHIELVTLSGGRSGQASSCDSITDISLPKLSTRTQNLSSAFYLLHCSALAFIFSLAKSI